MYGAREKHLFSEAGSYYDQPNLYNEVMTEMDSALSDVYDVKEQLGKKHDEETEALKAMGLNIVKK